MWGVYREAGRSIPQFSKDDVVDFLVTEAVATKVARLKEEARKEAEENEKRKAFKGPAGVQELRDKLSKGDV